MITPMILSASLMISAQAPADGADKPAEEAEKVEAQADDANKTICKRTAVIGSKFKKRICATKAEWETLRQKSADETRSMQRRKGVEPVG